MIKIDVFSKFKVKRVHEYSYISDKIGREYIFSEDKTKNEKILQGGELMKWIADDMVNNDTITTTFESIDAYHFNIHIEQYKPSGECGDIDYEIERIKE